MNAPTRRQLLGTSAAGAAALALAACSGGGEDAGTSGASDAGGTSGTRTVTDATGAQVEVPADPQKIVVLHYAGTQALIDLGGKPAGTAGLGTTGGQQDVKKFTTPQIWDVMKDVPVIDDGKGNPDVEKVAELEPDLILATNALEDALIQQLKDIAPVYQFLLRGGERKEWWVRVQQVADAVNRTAQYEKLQSDWQAELKAAGEKYAAVTGDLVVGVYDVYEEGNVYLWGSQNMAGTIITPLIPTWSAQEDQAVQGEKSAEKAVAVEQTLDVLGDANILFYGTDMTAQPNPLNAAYQGSDLYTQLPAVQQGHTYPFGKCTVAGFSDARYSLGQVTAALDALEG